MDLVEKLCSRRQIRIDIGRLTRGEIGPLHTRQKHIALVRTRGAEQVVAEKILVGHRIPAQFNTPDRSNRNQIHRHRHAQCLSLSRIRYGAFVTRLVEGQHPIGIGRQSLQARIRVCPGIGVNRVNRHERRVTPLRTIDDIACKPRQLAPIRILSHRTPTHRDPTRINFVGYHRKIGRCFRSNQVRTLRTHLNRCRTRPLIAHLVRSRDRVKIRRQGLQTRIGKLTRIRSQRGNGNKRVGTALRAKNHIADQPRQIPPIRILDCRTPAHHHTTKILSVRHRRYILRRLRTHLVRTVSPNLYRIGPHSLILSGIYRSH